MLWRMKEKITLGPVALRVGRAVRTLRERLDLTPQQLAEKLEDVGRDIGQAGIGRIERGQRRVDVDDLVALALALQVDVGLLLEVGHADPERPGETEYLPGRWMKSQGYLEAIGRAPSVSGVDHRRLAGLADSLRRVSEATMMAEWDLEQIQQSLASTAVQQLKLPEVPLG